MYVKSSFTFVFGGNGLHRKKKTAKCVRFHEMKRFYHAMADFVSQKSMIKSESMDPDADFKAKFMEYCTAKGNKISNSFTITRNKRNRIIQCLKNPQLESSSKFRFWVRMKKFRLIQSEDSDEDIVGIPADPKESDGTLYKRVACIEEFFDLINTAHVENGHIGLSPTYAAIHRVYALLPRCVVAKFLQLCPICRRTSRQAYTPRSKSPPPILTSSRLVDGGSFSRAELGHTITVVTGSPGQLEALGGAEIITDGSLPASAIQSIISQEGLAGSDVITEITLNQGEDGMMTVVPESSTIMRSDSDSQGLEATVVSLSEDSIGSQANPVVIFNCHICNKQFHKKLTYQRHLRSHREHNPSIPVVLTSSPPAKRLKLERKMRLSSGQRRYVIVDVDMSVDCTLGLMMAVSRQDVDIQAITCVSGAVTIEHTCNNVLRVLKVCNREDIPVFRGAEKPLVGDFVHQEQNLAGSSWDMAVDARQIEAEHAVSALIRFVNEYPGQITLVCLGPLTNLALALRLDPQVARKLKEICILGGNIEGRGNATSCAETNFYHDPEAAYIVLKEMTNITLLPYEVCLRHPLSGEFFYSYLHVGSEKSEFLRNSGDENWLQHHSKAGYIAKSAYAVAATIDPSVTLEAEDVCATVELSGRIVQGMMVVDWNRTQGQETNVQVIRSLDLGKIQSFLASVVHADAVLADVSVTGSAVTLTAEVYETA